MVNKIAFFLIRFSGLALIFRHFIQKKTVSVLLFHDPTPFAFEKAVVYLKKNYNIIDFQQFIDAREKKQIHLLPPKSVVLTFDDGHIGNYRLLNTLKKHQIKITVFLCAGIVNTKRPFWFKKKLHGINYQNLKVVSNEMRLQILKKNNFDPSEEGLEPQALEKIHIEEMKPFVNFQSHTMFHPILPRCSEGEAKFEIEASFQKLTNDYDLEITTLSYPNGDYSIRDIEIAKKIGYKNGITVDYGFNDNQTDLFRIKRLSVNDTNHLNEFIAKSSGVWGFIKTRNGRKQPFGFHDIK